MDLIKHLRRQREWSEQTFGPGDRTNGVIDHIRKELTEIVAAPGDLSEWIDVVILALDGAWRAGYEPEEIAAAIGETQTRNEQRKWPDWRTAAADKAIEHMAGITVWKDGKLVEATPLELVEQLEKYAFLADEEFGICSNWKANLGERLRMAAQTIRALTS